MKRFFALSIGLLLPVSALAAGVSIGGGGYGWNCKGYLYCGSTDAVNILTNRLIAGVGAFIFSLAVVVFFYGALRMVTSQGDEGKEAGKKALIYASLGLAAALLTGGMIAFVRDYIYYLGK